MNESFLKLPEEKQQRIINAAMQVFSKHEYKKASTDDIAAIAGISKGLLFYYFHNKKNLYLYIYQYSIEVVTDNVCTDDYKRIDDFFELIYFSINIEVKLMKIHPYIYGFLVKAYYSMEKDVEDFIGQYNHKFMEEFFYNYFNHINLNKFQEDIDPHYVLQMIAYWGDGYMRDKLNSNVKDLDAIDLDIVAKETYRWLKIIKKSVYKEEYLV